MFACPADSKLLETARMERVEVGKAAGCPPPNGSRRLS